MKGRGRHWWGTWDPVRRRRVVLGTATLAALGGVFLAASVALARLDSHVARFLFDAYPQARAVFVDLPAPLHNLALADLHDGTTGLLDAAWTDDRLCRRLADRVSQIGWIAELRHVRRTADARFEISARYRMPAGLVQQGAEFFLVDPDGVRLPGVHRFDSSWRLIQGVQAAAPAPGFPWPGEDLRAGLALLRLMQGEPFGHQITAVHVGNAGGRVSALNHHLELTTDRGGGRIRWGSTPGREFEENTVAQKLALLRTNYAVTGRCDGGHAVIDISTFPDRFTVPGSAAEPPKSPSVKPVVTGSLQNNAPSRANTG